MKPDDKTIERVDVAICGGGLVGLTLGVALARHGVSCAVIDPAPPEAMTSTEFDGRVSSISLGSKRVLEGIGVWPGVADQASPILEIRVSDNNSPLFLHYDHSEVGDEPLGWMVENRRLRAALLAEAAGLPVLHQFTRVGVATVVEAGEGAEVTLDDGRIITARLAVAADGRRSRIREAAGIGVVQWSYEQVGIVCTVHHERPHRNIAHERFLPAGPFAILPMTDNRSSLVWTERAARAPEFMALDDAGFLAALSDRFGDFMGALEVVGPRWSYPLSLVHAERYTAPRLALVGDAAHGIHPIAGQGFNLGIRDVAALAELVVERRRLGLDVGAPDLLAHYQRWRRFDTTLLIAMTDGLNRLFSNDIPPVQLVRDIGLAAVNSSAPLKRVFMRHAMGVVGDLPRLARGEPL